MNPIFSKLLPGLLPLIVYFIADEFFGTVIGIAVALGFGIIQLFYIRFRQKKWDRFILFDTALLIALGAVSLLLEDDKLIYWKFVFMDLLLIGFILFSLFSKKNLFLLMSKRYVGDIEMNDNQTRAFNTNLWAFLIIAALHAGITSFSILFLDNSATLFIGGTLLYILLGIWILFVFVHQRLRRGKVSEEYVPLVDEEGKIIGRAARSEVHNGSFRMHPVVHLHVIREDGAFLLQLRPKDKQIQPGKWDTAVGGHVAWGEPIEKALQRETEEEIGLKKFKPLFAGKYVWKSEVEKELVFVFVYRATIDDKFNHTAEVADLRWWTKQELKRNLKKGVFTPNFEYDYSMLMKE
ncbi:MAG: NUDIX domain-containing protein [Bacteroidales bacterium]